MLQSLVLRAVCCLTMNLPVSGTFASFRGSRGLPYSARHTRHAINADDWERTMDSSLEHWRRDATRWVRDFAAAATSLDEETLQAFVNTMLRELGEALAIDCCALIEVGDRPADASTYTWSRNGGDG